MAKRTCGEPDCGRDHVARGYCGPCYKQARRDGRIELTQPKYPWPENLLRRLIFHPPTTMPTGCIEFTGARQTDGYGTILLPGRVTWLAHRAWWTFMRGLIPEGLEIDHLCRNRWCVNPSHLEPVTHLENVRRGRGRQRTDTHCMNGHEWNEANTYTIPSTGGTICRKCRAESSWNRRHL